MGMARPERFLKNHHWITFSTKCKPRCPLKHPLLLSNHGGTVTQWNTEVRLFTVFLCDSVPPWFKKQKSLLHNPGNRLSRKLATRSNLHVYTLFIHPVNDD